MDTWLSLAPPLCAITLALISRQVVLSLFAGVWMGWTVLSGGNPVSGLADAIAALVHVFADAGNTRVILFSALVGSLITLTQRCGGVEGFVGWMRTRRLGNTPRSVGLLAWLTGVVVFVESSVTCLVVGAVARPLADAQKMSREKLSYICDSTAAPVCVLIPINAWGAYVMTLLRDQGVERPLPVMLSAVPMTFYAIAAVGLTLAVILTGRDFGPMKRAEERARTSGKLLRDGAVPMISADVIAAAPDDGVVPRARNMLVPIATMIAMMPVGLYVTGRSRGPGGLFDILGAGSGSTAVLWAVLAAIAVAAAMSMAHGALDLRGVMDSVFRGAGGLVPMAVIMMLAFALSATCNELHTGAYVASTVRSVLSPALVPLIVFVTAAFIAFSTGTSWGTFGIMMPIALPLAGDSLPLCVGAVLSGGVFGDHCSPISDTTVVASMATAADHIDHVRTQLPYALAAAGVAAALYLVAGVARL